VAQAIGSACITLATFAVAMIIMLAVNATGTLRLPAEFELYGMDLHEHGISAYPEYVITALGSPTGLTAHQQPSGAPIKATAPAHGD
jgi:ammonium transporter, Amt family